MQLSFEQTLACHCAPSLTGIKPADLISWPSSPEGLSAMTRQYAHMLGSLDIRFRCLGRRETRCLLLVYRQELLSQQLSLPAIRTLLARDGYPVDDSLDAMLEHLSIRMAGPQFPHEVGLFLGYPPADVEGFRRNQGRNCKLCGHWKVYSDVDGAQRRFRQYDQCRSALLEKMSQGKSITQLLCAVSSKSF